ncbi:hypothetical protein [Actinomadura sediminis]|uniref:Uncharacterized protein n=1 Tax=Actinomadura sediminis TaxID=1038904 RepID=A0ABW3EL31_9ACTN
MDARGRLGDDAPARYLFYYDDFYYGDFYYGDPPVPPVRAGGRGFLRDVASLMGGAAAVPVGLTLLEVLSR